MLNDIYPRPIPSGFCAKLIRENSIEISFLCDSDESDAGAQVHPIHRCRIGYLWVNASARLDGAKGRHLSGLPLSSSVRVGGQCFQSPPPARPLNSVA